MKQERILNFLRSMEIDMPDKRCFICKENYENVLEKHHMFGKKYSDQTILLCLNCHRIVTDNQNSLPTKIRKSRHQNEKDIVAINSIGSLHFLTGKELIKISKRLSGVKNEM